MKLSRSSRVLAAAAALAGLMSVAAVAPVGAVAPRNKAAVESGYSFDTVTVQTFGEDSYECRYDVEGACTSMTAGLGTDYVNETSQMKATLTSLDSGRSVPLSYEQTVPESSVLGVQVDTIDGPLGSGRYRLVIVVDTVGKWECSEYFEDGCIWFDGGRFSRDYRFAFDGVNRISRPIYTAPSTVVRGAKVSVVGAAKRKTTGTVLGRVERPDFTLTPRGPLAGRPYQVLMKGRSGWKVAKTGKTDSAGRINVTVRVPRGREFYWRIVVASAGSISPGYTVETTRRLRPVVSNHGPWRRR